MNSQKKWNSNVDKTIINNKKSSTKKLQQSNGIKKEQTSTKCNKSYSLITCFILPFLFALYAFYMMAIKNSDVLYTVQEHSIFLFSIDFFKSMTAAPGGFLSWLGCFFVQFFNTPWVGTLIMILIWALIYFITIKTFKIKGPLCVTALIIPASLLCSVIFTGYWLFYLKVPGYYCAESIGTLFMMLAVFIASRIRNKWIWIVWDVLWTIIGYIAFGWYALIGSLVMAIHKSKDMPFNKSAYIQRIIISAALIAFTPLVAYHFYTQIRLDEAWIAAMPMFESEEGVNGDKSTPFIIIAITAALLALLKNNIDWTDLERKSIKTKFLIFINVIIYIVLCSCVWKSNFDDYNYHCELRIHRAIDECRWKDAIEEITDAPCHPTREILLLRNIALMNEGNIGNTLFHYDNTTILPQTGDSLAVHMLQTNAPLTYMNYGRINFAIRWCIENGVEYGFCINDYKTLIRCSLIAHEYEAAQKYINILKQTLFYKDWAEHYETMIGDSVKIANAPEFKRINELYKNFTNVLDGDDGLIEPYLIGWFSHTHTNKSKYLQELTLIFTMLSKEIDLFWPKFLLYAELHQGEEIPIHYQEAAYLYTILDNKQTKMPFDQEKVVNRYEMFAQSTRTMLNQGMTEEQIAAATKDIYGDTFWWFYFFVTNIETY